MSKKTQNTQERESFSSRLGFILISAGCAIGLGNVWKFPYIVGENGGAAFLVIYIICMFILGLPLMSIEFCIGRASRKSNALAFNVLEPKGTKWHLAKYLGIAGQYLLMMFYTTITGWMLSYIFLEANGEFNDLTQTNTQQIYDSVAQNPYLCVLMMLLVVFIGVATCSIGVQNGLERITKVLMVALLAIMVFLAFFALLQPGSEEGLKFYLAPNFSELFSSPQRIINSISEAMSLAFFTLSVGIGSMLIFGSYIDKDRSLFGEAITIGALDTFVAIVAGLIIFPSCFSYGINPGSGPSLIFITLPTVFANMQFGQIWGFLFFVFLSFAAISTVNAVFESIIAFWMDLLGWSRHKSCAINFFVIAILSLPCALGFNVLSGIQFPFASWSSIMDVEDFLVSNIALPIGGVIICWFITSKHGWGWKNAITEINTGKGVKLPKWTYRWIKFGIPVLVLAILVFNWITLF